MRFVLVSVTVASVLTACVSDDKCEAYLDLQVFYTGTHEGVGYARVVPPGAKRSEGAGSGPVDPAADELPMYSERGCYGQGPDEDEPGWRVEAWIDLDGDDEERCGGGTPPKVVVDLVGCAPEAGDPQGVQTYTLLKTGETTVVLSFGDP